MDITTSEQEYCVLRAKAIATPEEVEKKRDEVMQLFKDAPVPGFRKGSRPDQLSIRLHHGKQIDESLKRALAEEAYHETLFQKNIKPFGVPDFHSASLLGKKFSCEFTLRRKPDFEIAQYKGLEIPKQHIDTTIEATTQLLLQELRVRFADEVSFTETDTVQNTDNIVITYDCFDMDGNKIEMMSSPGETMTIGRSQLKAFEHELLGMKQGERKSFMIDAPDTALPSLAGKRLKFDVFISMACKVVPMPLGDELAKRLGKDDMIELYQLATAIASGKVQDMQKTADNAQISNRLIADNTIKVPEWLTESEASYLASQGKLDLSMMPDIDKQRYMEMAESNVKLSLILDKIREIEPEAQLSDNEVLDTIQQMVQKSAAPNPEQVLEDMSKNGQLQLMTSKMRDEYVFAFITKNTKWLE